LERFEADLRTGLVDRLESDLARLRDKLATPATPRPELSEVVVAPSAPFTMPAASAPVEAIVAERPATEAITSTPESTGSTPSLRQDDTIDLPVVEAAAPLPVVVSEEPAAAVTPLVPAVAEPATSGTGSEGQSYLEQVLSSAAPRRPEEVRAAEAERANLDDDEFFATLRDAVRSDAPLGPAEDDDSDGRRDLFRRRR
jgi:hypothetical protein